MASTLSNPQDLATRAIAHLRSRAPSSVLDAKARVEYNPMDDQSRLFVTVTHLVASGRDAEPLGMLPPYILVERLKKVMLVKDQEAKTIAVTRRRMLWRGEQARRARPKRLSPVRRKVA